MTIRLPLNVRLRACSVLGLAAIACGLVAASTDATPELRAGEVSLRWIDDGTGQLRPLLSADGVMAAGTDAVTADIYEAGSPRAARFAGGYHDVTPAKSADGGAAVDAVAALRTPAGTRLDFADRWTVAGDGSFRVDRRVTVAAVGAGETAFGTELQWSAPPDATSLEAAEIFVPGRWYADSAHARPSALLDPLPGQNDFLAREDRMSLPLVTVRSPRSGWAVTLEHQEVDGAIAPGDGEPGRLIDARLQYGALGVRRGDGPLRAVLCFPGTEGEQSGIGGYKRQLKVVERLHPLTVGATQHYVACVRLTRADRFAAQMRTSWRAAFADARPRVVAADQAAVFAASIACLDFYGRDYNGVPGFPFAVTLPGGEVRDVSMQIGFVGQQAPCGWYLLDEGLRRGDAALAKKGERILDFWAENSLTPEGLPRTWYDVGPEPHWRDYHTFLRIATDGATGVLGGWNAGRRGGLDKPAWLAFCRKFGDWLLAAQNGDGSFYREFTFDGEPATRSKTSTLHPVRFLVDLSAATGDARYRAAAVRAGEYGRAAVGDAAAYVGGTADNPDVTDKEAGWIAFDSFLALYDVTQDRRWLAAAADAATFTETWLYCWDVPLPAEGLQVPRFQTAGAASLIALGHSGADVFLAFAPLSYYRLSLYTGDAHFAEVARLLANNPKQLVDVGGSLGYGQEGLLVEAMSLAVGRGRSVGAWLPWGTSAVIDPMVRTRDIFGTIDLAAVEAMPAEQRDRLHGEYARTRGFGVP